MPTPQEGETVTIWRSLLKRMAERFEAAAEEYRSQHGGQSLSLALFHFDKRFQSHYKATRCRVARQFVSEDSTSLSFIIEVYEKKRDCSHLMNTHVGGIYSENPLVQRILCSNMCLRTNVEIELGLLSPDQFNERTERHQRRFQSLIEEASRCLTFLPFDWHGRFEKASLLGGNYRWVWCLFDIAWKRLPGLPLVAGQHFFIDRPNCSTGFDIPYAPESFQENWDWATHGWCRTLEDGRIVPDAPTMPAEWEGRQPECYFSIVKDFYEQSVHFIDWLLSVEEPTRITVPASEEFSKFIGPSKWCPRFIKAGHAMSERTWTEFAKGLRKRTPPDLKDHPKSKERQVAIRLSLLKEMSVEPP